MVAPAQSLIRPISRFQRAIHVRYDLRDPDAIAQYIPTQSAADALTAVLRNTEAERTQRAHVLHAAYGSGKSHFSVALAALLEHAPDLNDAVRHFATHIDETDTATGEYTYRYLAEGTRLFPVVLSGNEGAFASAMLRALIRALHDQGIDIQLSTRFSAALETLERWQADYPAFLTRMEQQLQQQANQTLPDLTEALQTEDSAAYQTFTTLYAELTAGAVFDPLVEQAPEIVYRDVAAQLQDHGYTGIVVIWDEFGRYLEAHTAQAFGTEAAALQSFAETCNYSHDKQLHLLLFTHKELQGYAASLPQSYQQEWSRIEGRFQRHDLSTDPLIAYRLITSAIQLTDPAIVDHYLTENVVNWYLPWVKDYRLFGALAEQDIRHLLYQTWPLHPLTVFALAHLSNRVAQNERTMFTFLTSDEPKALRGLLARKAAANGDGPIIRVADLWDYFENAVRADIGGSGAHRYWSGVVNALDKVAPGDEIGAEAMRALGVLAICADSSAVRPTTDLIALAVGAENEDERQAVVHALDNLRRRKVIMHRQIDGYWTFISGSDINFEERLRTTLERVNPTPVQLRRLLEQALPPPYTLARRYNQQRAMIRYFTGVYRWADELVDAPWDLLMEQEQTDGLVIYVLATDDLQWRQAVEAIQPDDRVVYVLPREGQPLLALLDVLRELFALQELNNDPALRQHDDRERIQREMDWLLEDAEGRLAQIVKRLIDPRQEQADWIVIDGQQAARYRVNSPGQTTRIVSDICDRVFPATPVLNSEGLNRRNPTGQQNRAAQQVIDALFAHEPDATFGMEGRGPEILALNALLKLPGVLRQDAEENWLLARPTENDLLAAVWDVIEEYLAACTEAPQALTPLVATLTAPPYGLRKGVLPILFAAVLRNRLMVSTMKHGRSPVSTIDGHTLIQALEKPGDYSLHIGKWIPVFDTLAQVLMTRFDEYIQDVERDQQPLARLRSGMTRWLQGLPAFCRFTRQLSPEAIQFRDVIRKVQTEPAKAIFDALPPILALDDKSSTEEIANTLERLMQEIGSAYYDLQGRLDAFVAQEFGYTGMAQNGLITLKAWLDTVQTQHGTPISEFKFSSTLTQNVVSLLLKLDTADAQFWNQMSEAVLGVALRDWNDNSETRFQEELRKAREEVERDVQELIEEDKAVSFAIQLPDDETREFRFRSSDLSQHGQRLLQNFKSTMEIAGRPLSVDERRKIALAFLVHVMGEDLDD